LVVQRERLLIDRHSPLTNHYGEAEEIMKRLSLGIMLLGIFDLGQSASAQTATQNAEKRLAELLAPGCSITSRSSAGDERGPVERGPLNGPSPSVGKRGWGEGGGPVAWKASRAVEEILLPVKPYVGSPVRLPQPPGKSELRPTGSGIPEEPPVVSHRKQPKAPKEVKLPTQPLIRLPSLDVHSPLPIPILAKPQPDRASLGDPALQASVDAALKRFTPTRDRPAPFVPLNLPDPFEHVRAGQLRNPPPENPMPPVIPLKKPTK
jgi:hypothetical protein